MALNHLEALEPSMSEAVRILKPGGRIVFSDIHPFWPVSGHDYVEFFDSTGQEYRIGEYVHLLAEYWALLVELGMIVEAIREPRISDELIDRVPSLEAYVGIPLAMVVRANKHIK